MDIKRTLKLPKSSFFLFGPRATGKSTWLKNQVQYDCYIDLLTSKDFLRFSKHPEYLSELILGNPKWKCIIIDEIQKAPHLLDEVHSLIFQTKEKVQFILTGSSARKIKKSHANLLAGRALMRQFHPFTGVELQNKFNLNTALQFGLMPKIWSLKTPAEKCDFLYAYVDTYLKEEIQQEALTRNLPAYAAFLEHLSLRNTQVLNLQNLSQQIGVARTTLKGYLEILEDTLLGCLLQPIQLKAKVKEVSTPKFYFFDTGVVRALNNTLHEKGFESKAEVGPYLETYILHELASYSDYHHARWQFHYWATPSESEVDFIVTGNRQQIGIEVKATTHWDAEFSKGLQILLDAGKIKKAYGVYLGKEYLRKNNILVIPAHLFSHHLAEKSLF